MKEFFDDELTTGMQQELRKYAADEKGPDLGHAAECLHAALEILEDQGMVVQADQLLQVLQKIAVTKKTAAIRMPSIEALLREGLSKHDLIEAGKGDLKALAKFNLVLRRMGIPEHEIKQILGTKGAMPEQTAKDLLNPNRALGNISEWVGDPTKPISSDPLDQRPEEESDFMRKFKQDHTSVAPETSLDFRSIAQKKSDFHIKGLTPDKMVANLKHHGTEFNMADVPPPRRGPLTRDDLDADFTGLIDSPTFDIDASDDELMGMDIKEDSLEVFDKEIPLTDFEDERD